MGQRAEAYIVDAIRTPTGKRRGSLATVHGADLGGFILKALVERHDIPDDEYEDVVFGCLDTIGPLAGDIARTCWLAAGSVTSYLAQQWIDSAVLHSRRCILPRRPSCRAPWMLWLLVGTDHVVHPDLRRHVRGPALRFDNPFTSSEGWVARYGTQEILAV